MKYGYARVSPGGKSESVDAQNRQLTKAGCRKVFRDVHVSGAKTDRAQLRRLLDELDDGDVVMVTRLDRLARSTRDLLNILATITAKKAGFKSLGDTWADTTTSHGRLMLTVLGGLAEFERDLIRARTGEGRERAKARGVKMGRRPKLTPHQQAEAIKRREAGEPIRQIARTTTSTTARFHGWQHKPAGKPKLSRCYYSIRTGRNPMTAGFDLDTMRKLFREVFIYFEDEDIFSSRLATNAWTRALSPAPSARASRARCCSRCASKIWHRSVRRLPFMRKTTCST